MTPKNKTVTSAGNFVLSRLDIEKLQCLYNCNGTRPGTCGGHHHRGDRGELESRGNKTCEWQLRVRDGYGIRLTIQSFRVSHFINYSGMNLSFIPTTKENFEN